MEAKDYFEVYVSIRSTKDPEYLVVHCLRDILLEVRDIAEKRDTKTDQDLSTIFCEQNRKVDELVTMLNTLEPWATHNLQPNLFRAFVKLEVKEIYHLINWEL